MSPDEPTPAEARAHETAINDVVAECIEAIESGEAIEPILARDPSREAEVRARLDNLGKAGILHPPEEVPERIGQFRVLAQLGHGGMGSVYLAEQRAPIHRRVAIKVIKLGMDTRQVLARFEAERQAMALMEHPGIAKVFDAGTTDAGRPYFVMEHIDGTRITSYADRHNLTTEQRLELMIPLCEAVQHAHQKGVIHRDIKPSNVLVRELDGRVIPTVIDFGVAKAAIGQSLTDHTLFTESGTVLGTPEYMSPEQARRDVIRVDTRTDVYSLGVMLYELLTGVLPFDPQALRRGGLGEMQRILNEEEPQSLSTRVSTAGDDEGSSELIARARGTDAVALRRRLRGDLDWITRKALEKDPSRRYATPVQLAADIRRHLDHEPVSAGPPGLGYRIRKLVRRHRVAVGAIAAVLLAMSIGLVTALVFWADARSAQRESERARARAQRDYDRALEAVDAMFTAVGDKRLQRAPGIASLRSELLQKAASLYQGFLAEHAGDAALIERNAFTYGTLSRLHDLLGELEQAEAEAIESCRLFRSLLDDPNLPPDRTDHIRSEIGQAHVRLGGVYAQIGRPEAAKDAYLLALEMLQSCGPEIGETEAHAGRIASAYNVLGTLLARRDPPEAERALRAAAAELERFIEARPESTLRGRHATTLSNLGLYLLTASRWDEAEPILSRAKRILDELIEQDPESPELRSNLAAVWTNISYLQTRTRRSSIAHEALDEAIRILRTLAEEQPLIVEHREQLAGALNNLGSAKMALWHTDEARTLLLEAVRVYEELTDRIPENPAFLTGLARAYSNLARTHLIDLSRPTDAPESLDPAAAEYAERATALLEERIRNGPEDFELTALTAQVLLQRSDIASRLDDEDAALAAARRAQGICDRLVSEFPDNRNYVSGLVRALQSVARSEGALGHWQAAVNSYDDAIDTHESAPAPIESAAFDQMNLERLRKLRANAAAQLKR